MRIELHLCPEKKLYSDSSLPQDNLPWRLLLLSWNVVYDTIGYRDSFAVQLLDSVFRSWQFPRTFPAPSYPCPITHCKSTPASESDFRIRSHSSAPQVSPVQKKHPKKDVPQNAGVCLVQSLRSATVTQATCTKKNQIRRSSELRGAKCRPTFLVQRCSAILLSLSRCYSTC